MNWHIKYKYIALFLISIVIGVIVRELMKGKKKIITDLKKLSKESYGNFEKV